MARGEAISAFLDMAAELRTTTYRCCDHTSLTRTAINL
jgi:hypothetical protein